MSTTMDALGSQQKGASLSGKSVGYFSYLPIGFFGSATGISGLGSAWRLACLHFGLPIWPSAFFAILGIVVFVAIATAYAIKLISAPKTVLAEFHNPIAGSLFALLPITFLLLPIPLAPYVPRFATSLWAIGAATCILLSWVIVHRWLTSRQQTETASPAWLVAVAGPLNLPLALPVLGLNNVQELAVFALAVGLFFTIPVFTLVFSRLIFETPPPPQAKAALLILSAPFSIGYSAYVITTGQHDVFSECLYMINLFLLCILLGQLVHLPLCCPFRLSWWAVSFPLAASTSAALRFASTTSNMVNDAIAVVLLGLTTIIVLWLFTRTTIGILTGELRNLAGP